MTKVSDVRWTRGELSEALQHLLLRGPVRRQQRARAAVLVDGGSPDQHAAINRAVAVLSEAVWRNRAEAQRDASLPARVPVAARPMLGRQQIQSDTELG